MNRLHWLLGSAILVLVAAAAVNAQQRSVRKPLPPAVVSGRIFGITESGDLKPARLANVYLIFKGSGTTVQQSAIEKGTAGWVFNDAVLDNFLKAEDAITKMLEDFATAHPQGGEFDQDLECRKRLLALDQSIMETTQWVQTSGKVKQLLFTDADEEGYFRITKVPAGRYKLEARGQAGISDASWSTDVTVKQGEEVSLKLGSPGLTCRVRTPSG